MSWADLLARKDARGSIREYGVQNTFYTPAGVSHWHGATPDQPMRQVSVSFGVTTYRHAVTDAEYLGR